MISHLQFSSPTFHLPFASFTVFILLKDSDRARACVLQHRRHRAAEICQFFPQLRNVVLPRNREIKETNGLKMVKHSKIFKCRSPCRNVVQIAPNSPALQCIYSEHISWLSTPTSKANKMPMHLVCLSILYISCFFWCSDFLSSRSADVRSSLRLSVLTSVSMTCGTNPAHLTSSSWPHVSATQCSGALMTARVRSKLDQVLWKVLHPHKDPCILKLDPATALEKCWASLCTFSLDCCTSFSSCWNSWNRLLWSTM